MKALPKVGAKVRYTGKAQWAEGQRVVGTVLQAHKGSRLRDERGRWYTEDDWVTVSVHSLPEHWPYGGTSKFCPSISDIAPL